MGAKEQAPQHRGETMKSHDNGKGRPQGDGEYSALRG